MVSGKNSKAVRNARAAIVTQKSTPWGTIAAVLAVVLFAVGIFGYYVSVESDQKGRIAALAPFTPTADDPDPSTKIEGVVVVKYQGGVHVKAPAAVAYTHSPPFGGTHDEFWAACNGVVYPAPVRTENLVHSLEHGAVWIAYNPDQVTGDALATLSKKVANQPYTVMSPYPGLDQPVSMQSWGHQLKVPDPGDIRIDQFIQALRRNQNTHPEVGASCQAMGAGKFNQDAPPPFVPAPPVSAINGSTVHSETETTAGVTPDAGSRGTG